MESLTPEYPRVPEDKHSHVWQRAEDQSANNIARYTHGEPAGTHSVPVAHPVVVRAQGGVVVGVVVLPACPTTCPGTVWH